MRRMLLALLAASVSCAAAPSAAPRLLRTASDWTPPPPAPAPQSAGDAAEAPPVVDAAPAPPAPSPPAAPGPPRPPASPRIHMYDLPVEFTQPCRHWECSSLTDYLRRSPYYEPDHTKADLFWIPHQMPFANTNWTHRAYAYIRTKWPYLNRSIASGQVRHFITLTCDHGPGDCSYAERPNQVGRLPAWFNPADPARVIGHLMWNGLRDGADANQTSCLVCFQAGKDVQLPTAQNICGPLCGYSLTALRQSAIWGVDEAAKKRGVAYVAGRPARPTTLFYGGRIFATRGAGDASGRAQLLAAANASGFRVINTIGPDPDRPLPPEERKLYRGFDIEMPDAQFCYSPLGQFEGDTDRYIPSVLFGCIPVMLLSTNYGSGRVPMALPLQEHPDLRWDTFSVGVHADNVSHLPEILDAISPHQRLLLRHGLSRVWRRLLYTGIYGSYLGEDGSGDAFESLIDVLRLRVQAMLPLPTTDDDASDYMI